ncbi:long-chain-fatty-acid--CoA ligase [Kineosporia succinea]|uniref:Long-chain acyl-CoA synthetase n=1 Tax=Kineosporia succinea TaxID=84632 RepID=A0ABT9P988_9ACTN|nr:long-chain-fatty-acid--CoA ligase [Kineosporia succinea]MDP9829264.1 long-chain acyl-CoA synthetase [Kineosporia succinea]
MPDESIWAGSYGPGVRLHLEYGDETLVDQFEATAARFGDRPALEFLGRRTSYAQFGEQVARVAEGLRRLGVKAGDHVALLLPTCPQHIVAFHALLRLGVTVVEHNPLYTTGELRAPFADHGAEVAIVWDKAVGTVEPLRADPAIALRTVIAVDMTRDLPLGKRLALRLPIAKARTTRAEMTASVDAGVPRFADLTSAPRLDPDHPRPSADEVALLLYTSGTSGTPKGVPLTHRNVVANCMMGVDWVPGVKLGQEVWLSSLPLFHAYGLTVGILCGIRVGALLVLLPKPDTTLLVDAVERCGPTFVPGVPPIYKRILDEAERRNVSVQGMKYSLSGAMALSGALIERWEKATGGHLVEGYGLTETSPIVVGNPMSEARRPGSIGVPFPDTQVRVVDPEKPSQEVPLGERGELVVRGPQVFGGYRDRPEETAEVLDAEGWFRTGDIVTMAPDGFITVVDRIKEVVIVGGFNVYPSEVEEVLRRHPSVKDAAVVGLPSDDGDEVVAAVVPADGQRVDHEKLSTFLREQLTRYKVPRRFVPVEELPVNQMGKVLRREVQALVAKIENVENKG